jgi:hypothetical protein
MPETYSTSPIFKKIRGKYIMALEEKVIQNVAEQGHHEKDYGLNGLGPSFPILFFRLEAFSVCKLVSVRTYFVAFPLTLSGLISSSDYLYYFSPNSV